MEFDFLYDSYRENFVYIEMNRFTDSHNGRIDSKDKRADLDGKINLD